MTLRTTAGWSSARPRPTIPPRTNTERDLSDAGRVVRLLHHLGIERARVVQGIAEAAAYPEAVASLALVTPPASGSTRLWQLAARHAHPRSRHSSSTAMVARSAAPHRSCWRPTHATAVVLRDYTSALWTDTVADRADEVTAALLAHVAKAHARRDLDAPLVMANRGCARAGRSGSVFRTSPPSEIVAQAAHTGSYLAARLRVYTRNAPVGPEPSEAEAQEESTTQIVAD
jgi:hypothetical protein